MNKSVSARRLSLALTLLLFSCDDSNKDSNSSPSTEGDGSTDTGADAATPSEDAGTKDSSVGTPDTGAADAGGTDAGVAAADYSKAENWLCRPGHNEACSASLDTTIVKADGSMEKEAFTAAADPKFDCFYVYPTVSLDATANSDLVPGPEEQNVVRAQFARFGSQCRLFAPMYRQVTLTSLRASLTGAPSMADRTLGYKDVLAAFRSYLEKDNNGRPFVLVGHSQGSGVLVQLLKEELDKPQRDPRLITALLLGTNVLVPKDKLVGGTFQNLPLCSSANELGCVIVFASFRDTAPPPANSLFAMSTDPNLVAACTNPAALAGGPAELHSYLSAMGPGTSSNPMPAWVPNKTVDTPFVSVPGMITGECKAGATGSYFAITIKGDPADMRVDDIVGDVVTNGAVQANWGLHLLDAHIAMGNLLDLVKAKAAAHAMR